MNKPNAHKKAIKIVGIITKQSVGTHLKLLKELVNYLRNKKVEIIFDESSARFHKDEKAHTKEELLRKVDLAVVLGGDGTLLKTARSIGKKKNLILGVNTGTLGFLTECVPEKMTECLDKLFAGTYSVDRRSLLRTTVYRDGEKVETHLALNDGVINQGAFARLITMSIEINNRQVVKISADGLIVSTPTGSTAHSLSAGGPIVHPKIESLVLTPICPRSLSMRSIIIPDNRQVRVTIETERRNENATLGLTIDGQDMFDLKYGDIIKFRRSKRSLYLVRTGTRYYKMLRTKLHWGGGVN